MIGTDTDETLERAGAGPEWARPVIDAAALWLHTAYTPANTKTTHANSLGIPRADQRLWRGEPTSHHNVRDLPSPTAFFPWCAAAGINPLTTMTRDGLRAWITTQTAAGVAKSTQKARLGAVSAWYREMRVRGLTDFEVPAALPQTERRNLGVLKPAPKNPTVPVTLAQVRALRTAAALYPRRGSTPARYRVIIAMLSTTGIRAEELCTLDRGDIHRAGPDGQPAAWILGKGDVGRWVRLTPLALEAIEDYIADRDAEQNSGVLAVAGQISAKPAEQPLLITSRGRRLQPQEITRALRTLARWLLRHATGSGSSTLRAHAAALRPVADTLHPHSIRHFYAITAENHGIPISNISADLGHASIATTEIYLEQGRRLAGTAAPILADLITAGEELALLPQPVEKRTPGSS
ncbi:tyrosine-type recombinase/integrase [Amycolatopsis magusensis]|uniref:tyrosine-type recombinase/integrase n=1 Tax=Amycolatopsis magusensis TaxID=882444 RepID=UPI003787D259